MSEIQVRNDYRTILKLALPVSVSLLIPQLNILTNTLFLGYYKPSNTVYTTQDLLGASGIAGIYYLTLVMIGYGLVSGLLMLMSRKAGMSDKRAMGDLFAKGALLALVVSASLMSISYIIIPKLFTALIHEASLCTSAISFSQLRLIGLPFIVLSQLCNSFFLSVSRSKNLIIGTLTLTLVNITLDYILIYGKGPAPEMGLNGSAVASVCAEFAGLLSLASILYFTSYYRQYEISLFKKHAVKELMNILATSAPLMVQYFLSIGAWFIFFVFVEHIGKAESAVSQILRSVFGVVGILTWALASTCNSMVSNLIGQGRHEEVIALIHKIVRISLLVSIVVGLGILLFPSQFLGLLTHDVELIEVGTVPLRVVVLAAWMLSVSTIYFNGVVGVGNTKMNMIFEFVAIACYLIYTYTVVEVMHLSLPYAWASEFVYWSVLLALSYSYLHSNKWKKIL